MTPSRLLLLSNSTNHGAGYLDHVAEEIRDFFGPLRRVLFVPFALQNQVAYYEKTRARLQALGYEADRLPEDAAAPARVQDAEAVFIGGGNTFRLLSKLYQTGVISSVRARVQAGMPYMGSSAGTNVACPAIKTTNDMPIVYPPSFDALNLVPFNINPHYIDPDPNSTHQGETRIQRIAEYHEENSHVVVGLREGAWLRIEGGRVRLQGANGAKLFRPGERPYDVAPGEPLDFLLK